MSLPTPLKQIIALLKKTGKKFQSFLRALRKQLNSLISQPSSDDEPNDGSRHERNGQSRSGVRAGPDELATPSRSSGSSDETKAAEPKTRGHASKDSTSSNGIPEYFHAAQAQKRNDELASAVKNVYLLERGYTEVARLNYQHFLFKNAMGFLIHPSLLEGRKPEDLKIVDIGTGTAQWPIDLSSTLPNTSIEGYDISDAQYPPPEWLPGNVKLGVLDIVADELPEEMVGKYDIVHLRLLMSVVRANDPSKILTNLVKLLKPGGWLQWCEYTPETFGIHSVDEENPVEKIREIHERIVARMAEINSYYDWIPLLADTFASAPYNLQHAQKHIHTLRPIDYFAYGVSNLQVYRMLLPLGIQESTEVTQILKDIAAAWEECKEKGGMMKWEPVTYLGQKPLDA